MQKRQAEAAAVPKPLGLIDPEQKWTPALMAGTVPPSMHPRHRRSRRRTAAEAQDAWAAQNSPNGGLTLETSSVRARALAVGSPW